MKYIEVDFIGMSVQYSAGEEDLLTPENLRRYLIGVNEQKQWCIQAEDLRGALDQFYSHEAAQIGYKHKAIWLADSENNPIIEYSGCEHMIDKGWFACGAYCETEEERETESMSCILDGSDSPPDICPIQKQQMEILYTSEVVQIGGIWLKRYSDKVKKMKSIPLGNARAKKIQTIT